MYEKLSQEIKARGLSERQLAIAAGIVPQSLNAAMHGHVRFWPGWRRRVAEVLEMTEQELFPEGEKQQGEKSARG